MINVLRKIYNSDVKSTAAIALSKLATGTIPTGWTVAEANLATPLIGNYVDASVNNTALLALNSSPATLVSAPASGYAIVVDGVLCRYSYLTAALTGPDDLLIKYTNGSGATVATIEAAGFLDAGASGVRYAFAANAAAITPVAAAPIVVQMKSADPTVGAGSLSFRVFYHLIPTT